MDAWLWIVIAGVVLLAVALGAWLVLREARTDQLRERFGQEYDRTVDAEGGRAVPVGAVGVGDVCRAGVPGGAAVCPVVGGREERVRWPATADARRSGRPGCHGGGRDHRRLSGRADLRQSQPCLPAGPGRSTVEAVVARHRGDLGPPHRVHGVGDDPDERDSRAQLAAPGRSDGLVRRSRIAAGALVCHVRGRRLALRRTVSAGSIVRARSPLDRGVGCS